MASVREQLAAKCKIDTVEFWAQSVQGGFRRNLVGHGGIGVEGERFEDLGEEARRETVQAELFEDEYLKLVAVFENGKKVGFTHPLFGVKQVRIEQISYRANDREMVDATIVLVEDGEREMQLAPVVLDLGTEAAKWDGVEAKYAEVSTQIVADGYPVSGVIDSVIEQEFSIQFSSFSDVVELALTGEAIIDEVSAAYETMAAAANDFISEFEDLSAVYAPYVDLGYETIAVGQDIIRSMSVLDSGPWNLFMTQVPTLIGDIAAEYLGVDSEENVDLILEHNPQLLEVGLIQPGFEIVIPVS
jgi:hypothetical protein